MHKKLSVLLCLLALFIIFNVDTADAAKKTTLKMKNGQVYYGEVKNGKPHGKGTMTYNKYKTYSGDWVNGKRSGEGKYTYKIVSENEVPDEDDPDGFVFRMKEATTIIYTGSWANDSYNGKGILTNQWMLKEFNSLDDKGNITESYRDYGYSISEGTFSKGKLTKGYFAGAGRDGNQISYKDSKTEIVINNFYESKLSNIDTLNDRIKIDYVKNLSNSTKDYISINPSNFQKGTVLNEKFTGVYYLLEHNWETYSYDASKENIKKDKTLSKSSIAYDSYMKNRQSALNSFLDSTKSYAAGLESISKKLRTLLEDDIII